MTWKKKVGKSMGKKLVAYFSVSGNTKKAAEKIAAEEGADVFEIVPEVPYTEADVDWKDPNSRSSVEMKDRTSRPKINGKVENFSEYDEIFLGFPIWWGIAPNIINTFIESYDFNSKTITPFATSGGSSYDRADAELKQAETARHAIWKKGKILTG